jgi:hypothetical protein
VAPKFKALTVDNWQDPDPVGRHFVRVSRNTARASSMSGDDWAREFLAHQLDPAVPDDVVALFDAGRGAMLYGFFFYPLYAVGLHNVYRAADAALAVRHRLAGGPPRMRFEKRIDWLP